MSIINDRATLTALCALSATFAAFASEGIYSEQLATIKGEPATLEQYRGKAMLVVNVASKCGFTKQYEGLEELYERYGDQGLVVLGFPCNQFKGQEPGSEEQIEEFCRLTYGVSFPMFSKIEVNGPGRHPLYERLAGDGSPFPGDIAWNFTKFLVGPDGEVIARYEPRVEPLSDEVVADVEKAIANAR